MIVVMAEDAPASAIEAVVSHLVAAGFDVHRSSGARQTILGAVGDVRAAGVEALGDLPFVADVVRVSVPWARAARASGAPVSVVRGAFGAIGGAEAWVAVELVDDADARGAALEGADAFDAAFRRAAPAPGFGLAYVDARGAAPSFVARPAGGTLDGWMLAAEDALARGAADVVLLEDGGGAHEALDPARLAAVRRASRLPIVVDVPAMARRAVDVAPLAAASLAAGADGVVVRARPPSATRLVTPAALGWDEARALALRLRALARAVRG